MLDILYEDKYLIAINKKANQLTIARDDEKSNNLYHEVSDYLKKKNKKNKVFIIHRLDCDTSGIVLFAKDEKTKQKMQSNWSNVIRNYVAFVSGPVKKNHDIIKTYLKETKTLFTYVSKSGKLALTEYEVIKKDNNHSALKIHLITGRKNQIRVHLKHIGNPIVGDKKYGTEKYKYMLLHANQIIFNHPYSAEIIKIDSKLPNYFISID